MAVILGVNNNGTSQLGNDKLAIIRNSKVAVLQGIVIKRGSTVSGVLSV